MGMLGVCLVSGSAHRLQHSQQQARQGREGQLQVARVVSALVVDLLGPVATGNACCAGHAARVPVHTPDTMVRVTM